MDSKPPTFWGLRHLCRRRGRLVAFMAKATPPWGEPGEERPMAVESAAVYGSTGHGEGRGQGPQEQRHRLRLEHRHRRRLDRAGVLARGDARLHRRRQGCRRRTRPAVLLASFVPMLLVSLGYKYLNKADPDAGTTFAWTTRAFGPDIRVAERLGDLPRRRARDGLARLHRRRPTPSSCSAGTGPKCTKEPRSSAACCGSG